MQTLLISFIRLYQVLNRFFAILTISVFGFESKCKYQPTCSNYTIHQIEKHGTIIGIKKGLLRILSCWSFTTHT